MHYHLHQKLHCQIRLAAIALCVLAASLGIHMPSVRAAACADFHIIFARGSGEPIGAHNYQTFKSALQPLLAGVNYKFYELGSAYQDGYRYDAVSLDLTSSGGASAAIGAVISGGEAFDFGISINQGINELKAYVSSTLASCPSSQFVLAGYSQGAMLVSKAIRSLDAAHITYAATFGDPKLYLPEGRGWNPIACDDPSSLSTYRAYVPDCRTYQGILTGYQPYQPNLSYEGKIGVWCNYHDIMCSSKLDWDNLIGAHVSYASDGRYDDAAEIIAGKIRAALGQSAPVISTTSTHDVAFLIDSTGSMSGLIDKYKTEARRLANDILLKGGRVALYEYRDLSDPFAPVLHCDFSSCDFATFSSELDKISASGGGDYRESLLSASLNAMNTLKWKVGANKSIIVLTDAGFHSPDRDKITLSQVISRSLEIDPVHFYALAPSTALDDDFRTLVRETGGQIFDSGSELSLSTDFITSLPAEPVVFDFGAPVVTTIQNFHYAISGNSLHLAYDTDAYRTLVSLDDITYGFTANSTLEITDLDFSIPHILTLTPYASTGDRGEPYTLSLPATVIPSEPLFTSTPSLPSAPASGFAPANF